jgi:protocatechuate 3,4-dioxygenase beta subunit
MNKRGWIFTFLLAGAILAWVVSLGLRVRADRQAGLQTAPTVSATASAAASPESPRSEYGRLTEASASPGTRPADSDRPALALRNAAAAAQIRAMSAPPRDKPPLSTPGVAGRGLSVAGTVTELESGEPVTDATVTLISSRTGQPVQTYTDEDGSFVVSGCPPEPHILVVTSPDHVPDRRTVTPESTGMHLSITLSQGLSVAGRVTDVAGHPLVNVRVEVPTAGRRTFTDAQGEFTLDRLEPRPQNIVFNESTPPYHVAECDGVQPGGEPIDVVLGWAPATVSGRVVDLESGSPQTSFTVMVDSYDLSTDRPVGTEIETLSDPEGEFEVALAEPGRHRVSVRVGASPIVEREVMVTQAGQRFRDLVFEIPSFDPIATASALDAERPSAEAQSLASVEGGS